MDPRLLVNDNRRDTKFGTAPGTPLVTLAWRALRVEHERRAAERKQIESDNRQTRDLLAAVAEGVFSLRRTLASSAGAAGRAEPAGERPQLAVVVERLAALLGEAGVVIVAPVGEPYTTELMDVLENVAQLPDPSATAPRVSDVIAPAILFRGGLLRMGKAVVAVPAQPPAAATDSPATLDRGPAATHE